MKSTLVYVPGFTSLRPFGSSDLHESLQDWVAPTEATEGVGEVRILDPISADLNTASCLEAITRVVQEVTNQVILVGHSYGALLSLVVACRLKFANISGLITVNGPLNPLYEISPQAKVLFAKHFISADFFETRLSLALECQNYFDSCKEADSLDLPVIFCTTRRDLLVNPTLHVLNGVDSQQVALLESNRHAMTSDKLLEINKLITSF